MQTVRKIKPEDRGDHCLNVFVSSEMKRELFTLATRWDCSTSDMIRHFVAIGIGIYKAGHFMSPKEKAQEQS